jgi:branched-subunit amino acid aminotransferase/4-amino-4-deoxychorismate lyase
MAFYHVSLDGQIVPAGEARVSLLNSALLNGFGVYESIEVVGGKPFHLDDHMARLTESAEMVELGLRHTADEMAEWATRLTRQLGDDCILRVVALGAIGEADKALVAMLPQPLPHYPEQCYQRGVSLVTYEGSRHLPACKSLNTLVNFLARRHATRAGAHEAVLCSGGRLSEGSRSNIFAVQKGELLTPPAGQVLPGITRDIVVRIAVEAGWPVRERSLWLAELPEYDEFFITSTSMHVMPVVAIDDVPVDKAQVGRVTAELMRRFGEYHRRYFEPVPEMESCPTSI